MNGGTTDLGPVLEEARSLGFLGPEDPQRHVAHAEAFVSAAGAVFGDAGPAAFLDLGSGAGVPGLVLALRWPEARATLLDSNQRRCAFVRRAADGLGLTSRLDVQCGRAEELGQDLSLREQFPLVVARLFGAPAVTAELATGFLAVGGALIVSEPPDAAPTRWPATGLAKMGFGPPELQRSAGYAVVVIRKTGPAPARYPRRTGVPGKRPAW
jgi:16S rRNA (guanine527-N7)-methyltransferase